MRVVVPAAALLLLAQTACPQHRFDPASRSAGGVWLRAPADLWCAFGAPALLPLAPSPAGGIVHYPAAWGLAELSATGAAAVVRAGPGTAAVSIARTGVDLLAATDVGVAYGLRARAMLAGVSLRFSHLRISGYGSSWIPRIDVAVAAVPEPWFAGGFRLTDLNRPGRAEGWERLRGAMEIAVLIAPPAAPSLSLAIGRDELGELSTSAGMSYSAAGRLVVRSGVSGGWSRIHAGLEVSAGAPVFGYGIVAHPDLGWSHAFWLALRRGTQ